MISNVLGQKFNPKRPCIWTKIDNSHCAVLLCMETTPYDILGHYGYNFFEDVIEQLNEKEISTSVGVSEVMNDISRINKMYLQALKALEFKFNKGKGQIIYFDNIQDLSDELSIDLNKMQNDLRSIFNSSSEYECNLFIERIFTQLQTNANHSVVKNTCFSILICIQICISDYNLNFSDVLGQEEQIWQKLSKFETIFDVKMFIKNILILTMKYVNEISKEGAQRVIHIIREYIDKNYSKEITVKSIADELHYNSNYLNNIYKKKTGETVLEYITRARVEAAKKLMIQNSSLKIYEICQAVGYKQVPYFQSIFKRYTGLGVKEYGDKINPGR